MTKKKSNYYWTDWVDYGIQKYLNTNDQRIRNSIYQKHLRSNIDYIFVLRENIIQNQEKIYKNFFGIFPNFHIFQDVLTSCTEGYDCLVLDNTSRSNKIQDCVFWYRAKHGRSFKIGSKELWSYCKKNFDSKKSKEQSDFDSKKVKKKNTPTVTVKKVSSKK